MSDSNTATVPPLVLASGSRTRQEILRQAGLDVPSDPPAVDEAGLKAALAAEDASAAEVAEALGELKATRVSARRPGALVLGADQMLDCDGHWFDKPDTLDAARTQLLALRGKTHRLISAAVIVRDGRRIWHHIAEARLTVRPFSEDFLDWYLDQVGGRALTSVGAYQIEGVGAQLFSRVQGDYFTILGLPLLPLLEFLRGWGVVKS